MAGSLSWGLRGRRGARVCLTLGPCGPGSRPPCFLHPGSSVSVPILPSPLPSSEHFWMSVEVLPVLRIPVPGPRCPSLNQAEPGPPRKTPACVVVAPAAAAEGPAVISLWRGIFSPAQHPGVSPSQPPAFQLLVGGEVEVQGERALTLKHI